MRVEKLISLFIQFVTQGRGTRDEGRKTAIQPLNLYSLATSNSQLATIFLLTLLITSCKNDLEQAKAITTRTNTSIETATNVEIVFSEYGVNRIVAETPRLLRYAVEKPYMEFPKGLKLLFYNSGKIESTMTANYATVHEGNKLMVARDNVVVVNEKGETLNTEELVWDEEKEIIYSNSFVKISTKDEIIMGTGMTANQNFTDYVIKNITGIIKVKSPQ